MNQIVVAVRALRKKRALLLTAVLTIGLGTGAATAIFSVVEAVLLRPLPYKDSSTEPSSVGAAACPFRQGHLEYIPATGRESRARA